ncbi:hypothetical protein KOW79_005639 [Hemibagrus wyckioides]|uniref:Dynein regulatory complex subunit 4 n=1 Tax=Hemibagrus wyckioides TaxID=337641 RepID=A0A9D3SQG5_9TELE|nr:hypothetical protein KOW79_005639 [Hemibagrus wyckioides]
MRSKFEKTVKEIKTAYEKKLKNSNRSIHFKYTEEIYLLLLEQVAEMKGKEKSLESEMAVVQHQNKHLTEPLQKAREEVSELKKHLTNYNKDKVLLARVKARLKAVEKELKDLKWENEVLEQVFSKAQQEREGLFQKLNKAILEVQQKSSIKNLLLERRLNALSDIVEKKDGQLNEAHASSNLEPSALNVISPKLVSASDVMPMNC